LGPIIATVGYEPVPIEAGGGIHHRANMFQRERLFIKGSRRGTINMVLSKGQEAYHLKGLRRFLEEVVEDRQKQGV